MIGQKRSTFPTSIKMVEGERQAPTEAELDRMLFELVKDTLGVDATAPAPEPALPTDAELRDQSRELGELGLPVPAPRPGTAEAFRDDMFRLLTSRL